MGRLPGLPTLMVTERLDDLQDHDLPGGGVAEVAAYLAADERQEAAAGLRATFGVVNEGLERVELLNPFELVQWELLDERGAPLTVPSSPPSLFVHRPRSAPWRFDSPLRILEVRRNGEILESDVLDSPSIEIDAAGECAVTFEIDRILDDDGTPPLQAGSYTIACLVTLIDAVDTERSRILRSPPIHILFQPGRQRS